MISEQACTAKPKALNKILDFKKTVMVLYSGIVWEILSGAVEKMSTIKIRPVAIGLLFALLALFFGILHGMAFGAMEESIEAGLRGIAKSSPALSKSKKKIRRAVHRSWRYLRRAHEHFMGLGTAALALIIFIAISPAKDIIKTAVSTTVGAGMFLYPLFWMLAGIKSAEVGAHAAKESLELLAQAGAGMSFIGLLGTMFIAVTWIKGNH